MLIKFFATGTGDGKGPTDYCCNSEVPTIVSTTDPNTYRLKSCVLRDDQGKPVLKTRRPPPEILTGDRNVTRALIDSLDFRWRYSSGVIAFAPEDRPTDDQQTKLMAEFEALAFAGMDRERYDILWIRHTHEDSPELHFVIPRVDLLTGKSYNPAPPGWERSYASLRDAWNLECGWARPDDPARARAIQPGHSAAQRAENLRAHIADTDDPKGMITDYLLACIEAGLIVNRQDIIGTLEKLGMAINRQGQDYISVRPRADAKPIRLKGAIFEQAFCAASFLSRPIPDNKPHSGDGNTIADQEQATAARQSYAHEINKRAHYNAKRYSLHPVVTDKKPGQVLPVDNPTALESMPPHLLTELNGLPTEDGQQSINDGLDELNWQSLSIMPRLNALPWPIGSATGNRKQPKKQPMFPDERDTWRGSKTQPVHQDWWHRLKDDYERIGKAAITGFAAFIAAIQHGYEQARRAERKAQRASEQFVETGRKLDQAHRAIEALVIQNCSPDDIAVDTETVPTYMHEEMQQNPLDLMRL